MDKFTQAMSAQSESPEEEKTEESGSQAMIAEIGKHLSAAQSLLDKLKSAETQED